MKSKKGFTLVEVLAVITIIGILALISVPTIDSIIRSSKEDAYEDQKKVILDSAKSWAAKNVMSLPIDEGEEKIITLGKLKEDGMITVEVRNPINDKCISNDTEIVIKRENNNYTYKFKDESKIQFTESKDCR